jgi:hypothetical protein
VLENSPLAPNRLKNIRVEDWGEMLEEMLQFWLQGKETTWEISFCKNVDRHKILHV